MKLVYICSPLRGEYEQNIKNAIRYCEIAAGLGVIPLAPHTIFTQYLNDTVAAQREQALHMGLGLLEKCDEMWRMGQVISEGMEGETLLAAKLGIPVHDVKNPLEADNYPVSADNHPLLGREACQSGSMAADYERGDILVCRHDHLKPESRTPLNQLWVVTHGNGCKVGHIGRSIFCEHITDGDKMVLYREEVYGIAKPEVLSAVLADYHLDLRQEDEQEQDGDDIAL